ncbi:MAG: FKBP-type peptidyl-prolyl cis-trans isomerase [Pseudomonadota bacterium]
MNNTPIRYAAFLATLGAVLLAAGCQKNAEDCVAEEATFEMFEPSVPTDVEGLTATVTSPGRDEAVGAGDIANMHYTGWLFDPEAEDGKGTKFDSSLDRNQTFEFPLGAGRVIRGWDLGVAGMQIGEKRTLKIAPELGYGERGAGAVIPPNATLLFEVELVSFQRCKVFD